MTEHADDAVRRLRLLTGITEARDADAAHEAVDRLMAELGLGNWGFTSMQIFPDGPVVETQAGSPLARTAIAAYMDAGLAHGDPMFHRLAAGEPYVTATEMFRDPKPRSDDDRRDEIVALYSKHQVSNLAAFAIAGPRGDVSVLSAAVHTEAEAAKLDGICAEHANLLRLAGTALASKLAGLERSTPLLTPAERVALQRLAQGERPEEIAEATNRSVRTVRHQIESARQRLGAPTTVAAVAMALEKGEIARPRDRN